MNTRTLLIVLAVVAVAFVATNCLAATVDANKPGDANKPADINKPGKTTIISASDFGTLAEKAEANKPADANKPAEPNKSKLCAISEKNTDAEKGKGCDKDKDANKPADPNCKK